jgi:acyl-CoA dehydrogenase
VANELTADMLNVVLKAIDEFAERELPDSLLIELDERNECPEGIVRRLGGDGLELQLVFVPFEYGGMGGGTMDVYRLSEKMAGIDLGLTTSGLGTLLGSDPIRVGGTPEQKREYLTQIAKEGVLFAYGATEPEAGSDLGAMKTVAEPVTENGAVKGYRISGVKQWISNGGIANWHSVLALAPGGPSWFVVQTGADGFTHGHHEDKHGIRLSNTASLFLEKVYVDADRLVGGVEGQGLVQAQLVFGYTRVMVGAQGLGCGWAALNRAIAYSRKRIQAGGPLSEKQGYVFKLIVPHAVALEAARAAIEETAERIDAGQEGLQTEGAVAKYLATEAGDAAADAAIQAHGGYGYTHDYMVEKIKRDVRITRIYEGTSEIMEMTISRARWQEHLKSGGQVYHERARELETLHVSKPDVGADIAAVTHHALAELLEQCRAAKLTRNQHVLFRLGSLIAQAEGAAAFARRAERAAAKTLHPKADRGFHPRALAAMSRVFARGAALAVVTEAVRIVAGSDGGDLEQQIDIAAIQRFQGGLLADMQAVADALYARRRR